LLGIKSDERRDGRLGYQPFDSISSTVIPEVDGENEPDDAGPHMKKTPEEDDLRPHYDFDYTKMKPNRFAGEKKIYKETDLESSVVRLFRGARAFSNVSHDFVDVDVLFLTHGVDRSFDGIAQ
jgi:hypothetical protein